MADQKGTFDTTKLLLVNCAEIIGLEDVLGSITLKRLNLKERITVAVNKENLTQGKELDNVFDNMAYVISLFEQAIVKKPEVIVLHELEVESLFDLYEKYDQWVESFREKFRKNKETISEEGVE